MKTIIIDGIEYNLTPKVLFKKGDFVVIQETTYLISKIEGINVTLSYNGRECLFDIDVLKNAHLWDITKDAKDGDVLVASDKSLFIYDGTINENGSVGFHIAFTEDMDIILNSNDGCGWEEKESCHPATKEQRDTLMKAMTDAGYEWDAEKKELNEIEQKPAWSEEEIEKAAQEWDSKANFRPFYMSPTGVKQDVTTHAESFKAGINWILKSIKDRVILQPKQEWSEEDENTIRDIIEDLEYAERKGYVLKNNIFLKEIHWLKSLRPQSAWKPSGEQISLLQAIVNEPNNAASEFCQITLKEVIRQLKKLREE